MNRSRGPLCAIHQPNLFPRPSTLAKLFAADIWIALDDVQFVRRDYQHRVRLGRRDDELANLYVQRFWHIDDLRQRAAQASNAEEMLLLDRMYARLCEDEFEIARVGLLDAKIWAVWHGPIVEGLRDSQSLCNASTAEFVLARRCLGAEQHEPSECRALIGRLRPNPSTRHRWWATRTMRRCAALFP